MSDDDASSTAEPAPAEPPDVSRPRLDRLAVVAATAAVMVAVGGALLELCYTLFRW